MRRSRYSYGLLAAALSACFYAGCVTPKPVVVPSAPPRPIAFHTCIPDLTVGIDGAGLPAVPLRLEGWTDAQGNLGEPFLAIPAAVTAFNLHILDGAIPARIQPYEPVVQLPPGNRDFFIGDCQPEQSGPTVTRLSTFVAAHVDPSTIPLEQLAAIRGAMWTARLNLPFGPRPGRDDNIIAFDFYQFYGAADRARMVAAYKARGYTHAVTGPVAGTDCYHGQFDCHDDGPYHMPDDGSAPTQAEWDAYLDAVQELWDRGLIPVYFHKPDGWEVPSMGPSLDALDALARQPRAQKLLRVVVYEGWEPSGSKYGWSNATYVALAQRGAAVFPHALRLLHTAADLDAPVGQNDDQLHITNGQGWANVAPYIHGWLSQWGGYVGSGSCTLQAPFTTDLPTAISDQVNRFATGRAGWPTTSAWGNAPVLVYAGEYAAFSTYWNNCPESASITIGNLAMQAGAAGYLDGGSAAVPVQR